MHFLTLFMHVLFTHFLPLIRVKQAFGGHFIMGGIRLVRVTVIMLNRSVF